MKLQYLGTAAAEGLPAIFCDCENCKIARELGDKNIRTRSQAIIDDKIIIDWPADTYWHGIKYGIDFSKIGTVIITHTHSDHLYPREFFNRMPGMLTSESVKPMTVYGSQDINIDDFKTLTSYKKPYGIKLKIVYPFSPFMVEDGYIITPLKALHGTKHPYIYLVEYENKTILYAHDTGPLIDETYEYLKENNKRIDFMSIDCTEGTKTINYNHHLNFDGCVKEVERLKTGGLLDENSIVCLNHFSHNGSNCLYDEISLIAQKAGFLVSFDGMIIDL